MIDLPGFGVLTVPLERAEEALLKRKQPTLVQGDGLLLNDFLEAQIDPRTGALRSLHVPGKRGNRLSIQLARREKTGNAAAEYSTMQLTSSKTIENSTVRACVSVEGDLIWKGNHTGHFRIDYKLDRGQRTLMIEGALTGLAKCTGSPWNSAYVLRTAWPNEAAILSYRACGSRVGWTGGKAVALDAIEIDDVDYKTWLLPAGLAFHQRTEERFMETIVSTGSRGDACFRFGVGVDLPNAPVAALNFAQSPYVVAVEPAKVQRAAPASWLMNVDAKHVLMQLESPLVDLDGKLIGMRLHISELANKSVTAHIRALREVSEAHRVDYHGGRVAKLTVEGDTTSIALRPSEMTFVDLIWAHK